MIGLRAQLGFLLVLRHDSSIFQSLRGKIVVRENSKTDLNVMSGDLGEERGAILGENQMFGHNKTLEKNQVSTENYSRA